MTNIITQEAYQFLLDLDIPGSFYLSGSNLRITNDEFKLFVDISISQDHKITVQDVKDALKHMEPWTDQVYSEYDDTLSL